MDWDRFHDLTSRGNIIVATAVAIYIMVFEDWGFGIWWYLIIPVLWFAASLLIAMPFGFAKQLVFRKSVIAAGLLDWLNYIILIPVTYYFLRWLNASIYG